jgi:integrase
MSKKFTKTWLDSLIKRKPPAKPKDWGETNRTGFCLRHTPGGELAFRFRYMRNQKALVATIGHYPTTTLMEAHNAHAELRRWFEQGLDPIEARDRQTEKIALETQKLAATAKITVRNVIAEWAWHYARPHRKRGREAVRILKKHLLVSALIGKPAAEITKRDLVLIIDRVTARKSRVMANRLRALIAQVFRFAAQRDLIPNDPASGLMRQPGGKEYSRGRNLDVDELRTFWSKLAKPVIDANDRRKHAAGEVAISYPLRLALKLILVTAQRPGEVAEARQEEFDLNNGVWTIPPERIKTVSKPEQQLPREHYVPLTDLALEIVGELSVLAKGRPHLVPNKHSKQKTDLPISEKALSRALKNCQIVSPDGRRTTLFGMRPFTPNDLRRSAASHMGRLRINRLNQNKVLNHSDGGVAGTYDRWTYWPEKLKALNAWSKELVSIVNSTQPKVVPINQPRRVSRVAVN